MPQKSQLISLIKIPKIIDDCLLFFAQNPEHIPFRIKRVYFITQAETNLSRGYHAHKKTRQVMFCIQGSIKLTLDDGSRRRSVVMDQPELGVLINNMVWHEMAEFKENSILLVLASTKFDEKDYIRDYEQFKKKTGKIH